MKEFASILVVAFFVILLIAKRVKVLDLLSLQGTDNGKEDKEPPPIEEPPSTQDIPVWVWNGGTVIISRTQGSGGGPIGVGISSITNGQKFYRSGIWATRFPRGDSRCLYNNNIFTPLDSVLNNPLLWVSALVPAAQFNTITKPNSEPYIFV